MSEKPCRFRFARLLTSAVLFFATPAAHAAGVSVQAATEEQWEGAQKTYEVGDSLFDAGRYGEALTAFRASYEIVASPNSRLMIARALRELGRLSEAHEQFRSAVEEGEAAAESDEKYQQTVQAARDELEQLNARVARVHVALSGPSEGAEVRVAGQSRTERQLDTAFVLAPGSVTVSVRTADGREVTRSLVVRAGEVSELALDLRPVPVAEPEPKPVPGEPAEPAPGGSGSLRPFAYVAGGVGVAGVATFAVFGALNNARFSDLEERCPGDRCPPGTSADIDTGRTYQTLANVGLVVGVVGLGAGAALFVLSQDERTEVQIGPTSVALRGRF